MKNKKYFKTFVKLNLVIAYNHCIYFLLIYRIRCNKVENSLKVEKNKGQNRNIKFFVTLPLQFFKYHKCENNSSFRCRSSAEH